MMEQIERKLIGIADEPRTWGDDPTKGKAFEVGFILETQEGVREFGEYRSTEEAWKLVIERATPSIGQVVKFDAEAKKPYQGTNQWKLKSYPGKPESDGRGGSGGGKPRGDYESSIERADRRLNDATSKVLGVAAVLVGDEGTPQDRASVLGSVALQVADAWSAVREQLTPDYPNLGAQTAPTPAPQTAPVAAEAKPQTWGPAKAPEADTAAQTPADAADLERAWTQLAEATGGKSKALIALNHHFDRKVNADAYSFAEVMEVLVAQA